MSAAAAAAPMSQEDQARGVKSSAKEMIPYTKKHEKITNNKTLSADEKDVAHLEILVELLETHLRGVRTFKAWMESAVLRDTVDYTNIVTAEEDLMVALPEKQEELTAAKKKLGLTTPTAGKKPREPGNTGSEEKPTGHKEAKQYE